MNELVKTMEGEAETEEKGLDEHITKGIKEVEEMMKNGQTEHECRNIFEARR